MIDQRLAFFTKKKATIPKITFEVHTAIIGEKLDFSATEAKTLSIKT